ncbi:hypothetical protein, partial [Ferrimicrobium acidiphilum]|uniref:hypothetical protein n=1 Tax=Ferrimicrobium acidiphilum TaxID=121039 RepID=UPI0023F12C76
YDYGLGQLRAGLQPAGQGFESLSAHQVRSCFLKLTRLVPTEKPNMGFEVGGFDGRKHAPRGSAGHLGAPNFHWTRQPREDQASLRSLPGYGEIG